MPVTISSRSAHAATNPRERIPDITATGVNTITSAPLGPDTSLSPQSSAGHAPNSTSPPKLSTSLPPLLFGTATFNYQFNLDPYALHPNRIVHAALESGIRAFDTSPYYGPAESILGDALHSSLLTSDPALSHLRRSDYYLLTKAGRIASDTFDYSPAWLRHSVKRSLHRLRTPYLDVVYLHDAEFVSSSEVLTGIRTLRRIRDETGTIKHVGISGYPIDTLCDLAELVLRETGEPLDIVQSYANYTIQNQQLLTRGLQRLTNAGVDVVPNASPLGMGLCRSQGVPVGAMGNWHPAPDGLRAACLAAARWIETTHSEKLENVALRFAIEGWLSAGQHLGSRGLLPDEAITILSNQRPKSSSGANQRDTTSTPNENAHARPRLGVSVIGVSKLSEFHDTMAVYRGILATASNPSSSPSISHNDDDDFEQQRAETIQQFTRHIRHHILGEKWTDFAWDSPEPGFVNQRVKFGVLPAERDEFDYPELTCRSRSRSSSIGSGSGSGTGTGTVDMSA